MAKISPRQGRQTKGESIMIEHTCDCGKVSFIEIVREVEQNQIYLYGARGERLQNISRAKIRLREPFTAKTVV